MALDLTALWDFSNPALSEQRFRDAAQSASPDDALILLTQIARTYGLRRDFIRAQELLAGIADDVANASAEAHARYLLELGRSYASVTHPPASLAPENKETARSLYMQAFEVARSAQLDYLAIDALHMMVCVDTAPASQLEWNLKAVAYMEASSQPDAWKWEAALRHNVGYAQHLLGHYEDALEQFRRSLAAHERAGRARSVRIAHWMIAWTLRAQGRVQDAIDIQLRLEREWEQAGEPDLYVFEELEHLYRASNQPDLAERYATKRRDAAQTP